MPSRPYAALTCLGTDRPDPKSRITHPNRLKRLALLRDNSSVVPFWAWRLLGPLPYFSNKALLVK